MSEQIARLEMFFKRMERTPSEDEDLGDDSVHGEYWVVQEPESLSEWSIGLVAMTSHLNFCHKFENSPSFFSLSTEERIKDVHYTDGLVNISCETTTEPMYMFTICIDYTISKFSITHFLSTLENSNYEPLLRTIEGQVDQGLWGSSERRLSVRSVISKIREIILTIAKETALLQRQGRILTLTTGRVAGRKEGDASQSSAHGSGSRSRLRPKTPGTTPRRTSNVLASVSQSSSPRRSQLTLPSPSLVRDDIPASLDAGDETDFTSATRMFESFWGECSECFIFAADDKKDVDIAQLELAPKHWVIRELEPNGVKLIAHYLSHMPDLSTRQTLCVMPQGLTEKPTSWDDIKDGKFWIINGQHSVEASKSLQSAALPEDRRAKLRVWRAFVVWTKNETLLRRISKFYNRCNHFGMFQPTWGTNVIGARHIWLKLGRPTPLKEATALGKRVKNSRLKKDLNNEKKWKMFLDAVQEKFSSIEVNATRKSLRSSKKLDDAPNIQNEIKIITADDSTFELWSEVISAHSTGELMDPDSMKKFKEIKGWKPERDGHLNREFFKFMGNMSTEDHRKLALHLLNRSGEKRRHAYPKVTMKKVSTVLESCYSSKEWIERRKRKQLIRRELHKLDPGLCLFKSSGEFRREKWKQFKKEYNITSATMRVLTEAPGEDFFSLGKLVCNKNKELAEISPYAKAVLQLFLRTKKKFRPSLGRAFMRPFDIMANRLGSWPEARWEECRSNLSLAVMDFRVLPNYSSVADFTVKKPFFESFMGVLVKQMSPALTDPPAWVWICGDNVATTQIVHFAQERMSSAYKIVLSDYVPCQNERLEDKAANNKAARAKVALVFLLKKGSGVLAVEKKIPTEFCAPDDKLYQKAGKYNELEYRITSFEFRMEFYLGLIHLFCKPGDSIVSFFGGGKLLCAALMNSMSFFCTSYSEDADDFKRLKALAKNLDMLDFAHNAYAVDESKFPRVFRETGDSKSRGKRKVVEIVDLEDDEEDAVEPGAEVQSPVHDDCCTRSDSSNGKELDRQEASISAGPTLHPFDDDDLNVEGNYRTLQVERAESTASALRLFSLEAGSHRGNVASSHDVGGSSQGRLDRGKKRVREGAVDRRTMGVDDQSDHTTPGSPHRVDAAEAPHPSEEGANTPMALMMMMLERQNEHFKQMQIQMQREMQKENREFQREVREESRNLLAAVPELIAQTVSRMGLAMNIQPLHALEGVPSSENPLLTCNREASSKSTDLRFTDAGDDVRAPPSHGSASSEELVARETPTEMTVTPAATLPAPSDRLVSAAPVVEVPSPMNLCAGGSEVPVPEPEVPSHAEGTDADMIEDSLMRVELSPHVVTSEAMGTMEEGLCTVSVTSFIDNMDVMLSQQSKGNILWSAATMGSTVETTVMDLEDGVVNSPTCSVELGLSDSSPSRMRGEEAPSPSSCWTEGRDRGSPMRSRASRQLYPILVDDTMDVEGARACNTLITFARCDAIGGLVLSKPDTTQSDTTQLEIDCEELPRSVRTRSTRSNPVLARSYALRSRALSSSCSARSLRHHRRAVMTPNVLKRRTQKSKARSVRIRKEAVLE